jgi:hypothetical protein
VKVCLSHEKGRRRCEFNFKIIFIHKICKQYVGTLGAKTEILF